MKLRHYLKGLGIGMVVTALILHFSVNAAEPSMTDEEVIARARELGMIENVVLSRNDPTISGGSAAGADDLSASQNMAALDDTSGEDAANQLSEGDDPSGGEDGSSGTSADGHDTDADSQGNGDMPDASGNDDSSGNGGTGAAGNGDSSGNGGAGAAGNGDTSGHRNGSNAAGNGNTSAVEPSEEEIQPAAGNHDEEAAEQQEGMAAAEPGTETETNTNSVTLTIYNGDSSVSVAGRLAALGLVSSQTEYDRYLCSHGYDRTIRTGVHVIPEGATEQQIAEIITSKQ